ncbi:MAG: N-acetyltransferase [Candidatus Omnitrophica bacterium]|nr:N-acetyltransferase [Candidatus Omnitrophota bacterium]
MTIHPTALIEEGVKIGEETSVWDHVHIRKNASIGRCCVIGGRTIISYDVHIGDFVKINSNVYIPTGVTIEDRVMVAAGCIFVNDRYPRAFDDASGGLASSAPNEDTLETRVCEGATLGAGSIILGGLTIGRYAMIGAGAVVTKSVADHALVVGNPARQTGWVQKNGRPVERPPTQDR